RDVLGSSSASFRFSERAAGVGVACGAVLSAAPHSTRARARTVLWALPGMSLVVPGQRRAPVTAVYLVLAVAAGLIRGGLNAVLITLMVTETDAGTRGRVVAFVGGAARSCTMLALPVGGVLGTVLGARESFVVVGVAGALIGA